MIYRFIGKLCGYLCNDCMEPLSGVVVRIYRPAADVNVAELAVANPKETFAVLTEEGIKAKQKRLVTEVKVEDNGEFEVALLRDQGYDGEAFEADVVAMRAPRQKGAARKPVQFTVTTIQPRWKQREKELIAVWDYCLPSRFWCAIRALLGSWTICGRLVTCKDKVPIPLAKVEAFDADWIESDSLGSAETDDEGRFRIDYATEDFQKTPISPLINLEWVGGPDLYFKAKIGDLLLVNEGPSDGRKPGRENASHCTCVTLCSDKVQPPKKEDGPEGVPHWTRVEPFNIDTQISTDGYAGTTVESFTFGGGILLGGNCPLSKQYRFRIAEWGWAGGGDGDASTPPSIAPTDAALAPVTQIRPTRVGYVQVNNAAGHASFQTDVYIRNSDIDTQGWVTILGKMVQVQWPDGTTANVAVSASNFWRTEDLMRMNSNVITAEHPSRAPATLAAGSALTTAQREPIRKYRIQFEVRDSATGTPVAGTTKNLPALVIDNTPVIAKLGVKELAANLCNPLSTASAVHVLYTMDHPHLRSFSISISSNNGVAHPPSATISPPTLSEFTYPNFAFRGGVSGLGGVSIDVSGDPPCAYSVNLSYVTRRYGDTGSGSQVLYCK